MRQSALWLSLLAACGDPTEPSPYPPCPDCVVLHGGSIFDGASVRPGTLVVRGMQISAVIFDGPAPTDGTQIDVTGQTILPGLFDLHVHAYFPPTEQGFNPPDNLARLQIQALLKNGVTSYLDLGAPPDPAFADREASRRNLNYPRIFLAGPMLTAPNGHPCVDGPFPSCQFVDASNAASAVDAIARMEPDVLKLIVEPGWIRSVPAVDATTMAAVYTAAAGTGLPLFVHVTGVEELHAALDLGVRRFAHLPFRDLLTEADAQRLAQLDVLVIPTMMFVESIDRLAHGTLDLDDPTLATDAPRSVIDDLMDPARIARITDPATQAASTEALGILRTNLALLIAHQVRIAAGTDCGNVGNFHGRSLRRELESYVAAGMTPAAALSSATRVAAEALERPDLGHLDPGAVADLAIVEGDPLQDLEALGRVRHVFKAGLEVDLPSLRR